MKVCVVGCSHGELVELYAAIDAYHRQHKEESDRISLVLCCGDFEAVRNKADLEAMAVPDKYKHLKTFHQYYYGQKAAPVLTIFIGGNHEASNHLQELPYGGWVAPNIYYLGYAGCVTFGGLAISGISGIYKQYDFPSGRVEKVPYDEKSLRTVFHVKRLDMRRLEMLPLGKKIDVFLSHDWPISIATRDRMREPNIQKLLRDKPFFRNEVQSSSLGSPVCAELLERLRPLYWFSAHLHVKFTTTIVHTVATTPTTTATAAQLQYQDPEEIDLDDAGNNEMDEEAKVGRKSEFAVKDSDEVEEEQILYKRPKTAPTSSSNSSSSSAQSTQFLALDKIVKGRQFMQVMDIPAGEEEEQRLSYDRDWLAIIKATHHLTPTQRRPGNANEFPHADLHSARGFIQHKFSSPESLVVPFNFVQTSLPDEQGRPQQKGNPQTDEFYRMLELDHYGFTIPVALNRSE